MQIKTLALAVLCLPTIVCSQEVERLEIPASFNPVGSGARAMGMGGSFISIADDATAASWNPAGLILLRKPEVALVLSSTNLKEDLTFSQATEASGSNSVSNSDINYVALSAPCSADTCGKNMVFSLNYQRLYDFSREWDFTLIRDESALLQLEQKYQVRQQGSLYAIGAAVAVQMTDKLTLGLTLNSWRELSGKNQWRSNQNIDGQGQLIGTDVTQTVRFSDEYEFEGSNFNLGLMWTAFQKMDQKLVVGLVYKSEFDADITQTSVEFELQEFPNEDIVTTPTISNTSQNLTLTMPSSLGLGASFQWSDSFTTSLDIYRTNWSNFAFSDDSGSQFSPISGRNLNDVLIKDTTQIRIGMEYRILSQEAGNNYIIPLRAGLFRDPLVADDTSENASGLSVGTGIAFETWVFDVAYQYRWASDIGGSYLTGLGFTQDINEHQLFGSAFYRF
jgi:long-subunit fatty acid transport protein